jgi:hypothetical protein
VSKAPWILAGLAGLVGVLVVIALLVLVIGGITTWAYLAHRAYDGITPMAVNPATTEADFVAWKQQLDRLAQPGAAAAIPTAVGAAPGWWDRHITLPPEPLVRAALEQRLPAGLSLLSIRPLAFTERPDGVQVVYRLNLLSQGTLVLVPTGPFVVPANSSALVRKWLPFAVHAADLPAGTTYLFSQVTPVLQAGQAVEVDWTVRRAARVDGKWRVLETDPIVYQRNALFEKRLLQTFGRASVLRTDAELAAARAQSAQSVQAIKSTAEEITARAAAFRREAQSGVPSAAQDTGGRGGSGTPTKTGVGVLGGAAVGGGIGAAAGDGEGAAIGAGAGALLGGIIGYNVGRADEKRAVQQQNSARQQAIRSANSRASAYQAEITRQAEENFRAQAEAHNAGLATSY